MEEKGADVAKFKERLNQAQAKFAKAVQDLRLPSVTDKVGAFKTARDTFEQTCKALTDELAALIKPGKEKELEALVKVKEDQTETKRLQSVLEKLLSRVKVLKEDNYTTGLKNEEDRLSDVNKVLNPDPPPLAGRNPI